MEPVNPHNNKPLLNDIIQPTQPVTNIMDITCKSDQRQIKLYICGSLHLFIQKKDIVGLRSWYVSTTTYFIKITTHTSEVLLEYNNKDKWCKVLELLDKHL
jgi:hypothetical protein